MKLAAAFNASVPEEFLQVDYIIPTKLLCFIAIGENCLKISTNYYVLQIKNIIFNVILNLTSAQTSLPNKIQRT